MDGTLMVTDLIVFASQSSIRNPKHRLFGYSMTGRLIMQS